MRTYTRRMKTASNKNLDVFDFKDEMDADIALRFKSKIENPNRAIDKYSFLATAAAGKSISAAEEVKYVSSLDIDSINTNHVTITLLEDPSPGIKGDSDDASTVAENRPDLSEPDVNVATTPASSPNNNNEFNSDILELSPSVPELDEAVELDPDENESISERSLSSSDASQHDGDEGGPSSDHCIGEWEMENEDMATVVLYPDHVAYHDCCYTDSVISFTSSFIQMEGSTSTSDEDEDEKTIKCKWGIEDILSIRSHWYERIEMAMVSIHIVTKDMIQTENIGWASGTELKFAVIGCSWYGKLEAIASLNIAYKALWTSMLESEDTVVGQIGVSLPNFDRPFEEVVYPKGDADAVSISKRDFDLLQPDTFVNDTIIDFYIKYLKNKIAAEDAHRFHFFNSFFFRKLADPDKEPLDASRGRAAFQRVKKWTRKVNLFEKDYVFIPVNYHYHWSLLVFCHLGDVATYKDENVSEWSRVPCVLHMDSIRGSHSGLKGLVQSYLKEEWRERQQGASEDISSRFDDLRFISLELPQQKNSYDCGLFLLHYVELFLEEAPLHLNPFKITDSSNFLNVDWFAPAEASLKRVVIQRLICDLLENPHQESCSSGGNDNLTTTCRITNVNKGSVVNLSSEDSLAHINAHVDHEMDISLSSMRCGDDPSLGLKPSGCFVGTRFPDFNHTSTTTSCDVYKGCLTPIQEDVEGDGQQFVYTQVEDNGMMPQDQDYRDEQGWENKKSPERSIEIVKESSQQVLESLCEYVQMVDGMDIIVPGGLESDVVQQHSMKKIRMTTTSSYADKVCE